MKISIGTVIGFVLTGGLKAEMNTAHFHYYAQGGFGIFHTGSLKYCVRIARDFLMVVLGYKEW